MAVTGHVRTPPGHRVEVVPPVAGRWMPAEPPLAVGARVDAGHLLGRVAPTLSAGDLVALAALAGESEARRLDFAARLANARAELAQSRSAAALADRASSRARALLADGAGSERAREEADAAAAEAHARLAAAQAVEQTLAAGAPSVAAPFGADGPPALEVRAPIAGVVTDLPAAAGTFVAGDRAVCTLLDVATVLLEADVPEAALARVGSAPDAWVEWPHAPGAPESVGTLGGRLLRVAPEVEAASRTVAYVYEVPNPGGRWRPGARVSVLLSTATAVDAVAIPLSAIVDEDGRSVAFVQLAGETFEKRDLIVGARDADAAEVRDGLTAGDRVVAAGAWFVRLAAVSPASVGHGHAH